MSLEQVTPINPNTANLDTLCLLPGIGPILAQRIITARPFETVQDLTRVRGVSSAAVERWLADLTLPHVTIQPPAPEPDLTGANTVLAKVEAISNETEGIKVQVLPAERAAQTESDKKETLLAQASGEKGSLFPEANPDAAIERRPPAATRSYVGWLVATSSLFILCISLLLSLGILAALNHNQLQFVSPAQVSALTVRIEGLETQADSLGQDIDGLRTRLSNLEAMGERMGVVELAAEALRTDVDTITTEVAGLSTQVDTVEGNLVTASEQLDDLEAGMEALRTQSGRFQTFLDGLQVLMDSLFQPQGGQ